MCKCEVQNCVIGHCEMSQKVLRYWLSENTEPSAAQKCYFPCTFQYGGKRLSQLNFTENNLIVFNLSSVVILFLIRVIITGCATEVEVLINIFISLSTSETRLSIEDVVVVRLQKIGEICDRIRATDIKV